jgi:hypothetical protein
MVSRLLIAIFLVAHGAVHALYFAPPPPATAGGPTWPFELGRSWILGPLGVNNEIGRVLGIALIALTIAGFALAGLAALGIAPGAIWPAAVTIGAVASLALLGVFFDPWLLLGVAIDVGLVWLVLVADWAPEGVTP